MENSNPPSLDMRYNDIIFRYYMDNIIKVRYPSVVMYTYRIYVPNSFVTITIYLDIEFSLFLEVEELKEDIRMFQRLCGVFENRQFIVLWDEITYGK